MKYKIKTDLTIPSDLKSEIIEFAEVSGLRFFNSNGVGRRFCNLNKINLPLKNSIKKFSTDSYNHLGINKMIEERLFGNFIGVNSEGGSVHQHTDPNDQAGNWHVRLNFMIQKPIEGGNPVIDGLEYNINENESWLNFASIWNHSSMPVVGSKNRIVLSLGNYIQPSIAKKLLNTIIDT